jgi:uncharacterized protein (DUF2141 family)
VQLTINHQPLTINLKTALFEHCQLYSQTKFKSIVDNYKIMLKISKLTTFLLATIASMSFVKTVQAQPTETLTVIVDGIKHQKGQICLRVFSNEKGFPQGDTAGVQSSCISIKGTTLTKQFYGLKPGTYAVGIVDDQNGDHKLNSNLFGIPEEGFGVSNNPTVSIATGSPKFSLSSFVVNKNTTIKIHMKYSLDK